MNTYSKYAPNIFLAKCEERQEKGAVIPVTTKYQKENDSIVYNLIYEKDGFFYYSIIRADGMNFQERAKAKADRLKSWAGSAERKSNEYHEASNEGRDFLRLAEPIKIGHHSEKRHRALIERNRNRMNKAVEFSDKAESYESRAEYWDAKANEMNISMPESLEYYEYLLDKAKEKHEGLKSGEIEKSHSYSLTYAKKNVNVITKMLDLAKKLWA
jgi:hypothetical protein